MDDTINLTKPKEIVCIVCPNGCRILCEQSEGGIKYSGNKCRRGIAYAETELTRPMRTLTTSVKTAFPEAPVVSVRTDGEIEKSKLRAAAAELGRLTLNQRVKIGDIVLKNICGTGVDVVCTSDRLVQAY